jgi:hypothetical protein
MTAPLVSCVVATHNHERYIAAAIGGVLAQDYPREAIEVIVVDDGSTDHTPDVLAKFADRGVRVIRQDNAGHLAAFSRGIGEATGELIALLDGDDVWLPDKLTRQVGELLRRPELGMVFGDMRVIDEAGAAVHESYWRSIGFRPPRGRIFGSLIHNNCAQTSTIVVRASLRDRFHPIPSWARAQDWWIGLRVSEVAEVDHLPGQVSSYRVHGGNLWHAADAEKRLRLRAREIELRRWLLAGLRPGQAAADEALHALDELRSCITEVAEGTRTHRDDLAPVSHEQRERSIEMVAAANAAIACGDGDTALLCLVNALGLDPHDAHALARLSDVVRALRGRPPRLPDPRRAAFDRAPVGALDGARSFVGLAFANELVADPGLLGAWTGAFTGEDDATLAIYAPDGDVATVHPALAGALAQAGLDVDDDRDIVAVVAPASEQLEAALARNVHAVCSRARGPRGFGGLPATDDPEALRALATRRLGYDGLGRAISVAIKICPPTWDGAERWGDLHFARAIADELGRRGHRALIQVVAEWDDADGRACEVALHLRGLYPYVPHEAQLNVLWAISHPDLVTAAECDRYDLVFSASARHPTLLGPHTSTPIAVLDQATDPAVFFPDRDADHEHPLVFVGNSRGVQRPIVRDAIAAGLRPRIWGAGWERFVDASLVVGEYLPNDQVRRAYSSAGVVLNDHWDDMRAQGFISNRVYDVLAAGGVLISDDFPELRERFGDALLTYRIADELAAHVARLEGDPAARAAVADRGRDLVLARHTFAHRVDTLLAAVAERLGYTEEPQMPMVRA